jgi:hypothetical protein
MRSLAAILLSLAFAGCVTGDGGEDFSFDQSTPMPNGGKGDGPTACGDQTCDASLCGYDCSVAGQQAKESCASTDGRAASFVAASIGGSESGSFDSRANPYVPKLALDNVLVYGCEMWDFSGGSYDGFEVQYEELIHSSFAVNPDDPTRTLKHFGMYMKPFAGPGSYRAEAEYRSSSEATQYEHADACSVDVTVDSGGTVSGSFSCAIPASAGGSVSVQGTFGCAKNAMNPIFSAWAAAPH